MALFKLEYLIAFAGIWSLGNGLLHDLFVLLQRKPYDRELIRLLIDGHILIFSGILYLTCYKGIANHHVLAYYIAVFTALFLLGYCAFIFKILPSFGTLLINVVALVWLLLTFPK